MFMKHIRGIHQKSLYGLSLCFTVGIAKINVPRVFIAPCTIRETDIVKLDLMESHQHNRFNSQIHLILPNCPVKRRWPVLARKFQWFSVLICDGIFGIVIHKIGIIKCSNSANHIVARFFQFLYCFLVLQNGIVRRRSPGRAVPVHHIGSITHRATINNVYDEGIDSAVFSNLKIGIHLGKIPVYQIKGTAFLGHFISLNSTFDAGIIVKICCSTAAVQISPPCMNGIIPIVKVSQCIGLIVCKIPGHNIARFIA